MSPFPDEWKQSKIISVPKCNNQFRPIVILPFLPKVMGNLIARPINNYLVGNQSGFMKARSCTTALVNVVDNFRLKLGENYITFLVPLDPTKAFDMMDHRTLLKKLHNLFHFLTQLKVLYIMLWTDHNEFTETSQIRSTLEEVFLRE